MIVKNNYNECLTNLACSIRKYFELRPKYALQHMKEYLDLDGELEEITIIKDRNKFSEQKYDRFKAANGLIREVPVSNFRLN